MEYVLKASAVIVLFYACYKGCLQRDTFFQESRWFLLVGIFAAFLIPFLVIPVYVEQAPLPLKNMVFVEHANPDTMRNSLDTTSILKGLYILGLMIFGIRFISQLTSLMPVIRLNECDKIGGFRFIKTTKNLSPFSFFNYIVYNPTQFNALELEQIITHEKVHVRQLHTIDILLAQLSCAVLWFNPFIWLYHKELKQNLEFIADSTAIGHTPCKKSYQYTLLKTSLPNQSLALTNNFYNSLIKKRIVMLHKSKSKRINLLKFAVIIPALTLFLMSFNTKEIMVEKSTLPLQKAPSSVNTLMTTGIEGIITKDLSDSDLETLKATFKNKGITLNIKGVKRNKQGDITAIKIEVNSKSSNANYSIDTEDAINPIKISVDTNGKNIAIGNGHLEHKNNMVLVTEDGEKHLINHSGSNNNVFVISSDDDFDLKNNVSIEDYKVIHGDSIHVYKLHKNAETKGDVIFMTKEGHDKNQIKHLKIKKTIKGDSLTWNTHEDESVIITKDEDAIKKHKIIIKEDRNQPLYLLDGKEISKEMMNDIHPDTIEKVEVFKGDSAIEKYGDKANNGVIVITSKKI